MEVIMRPITVEELEALPQWRKNEIGREMYWIIRRWKERKLREEAEKERDNAREDL